MYVISPNPQLIDATTTPMSLIHTLVKSAVMTNDAEAVRVMNTTRALSSAFKLRFQLDWNNVPIGNNVHKKRCNTLSIA